MSSKAAVSGGLRQRIVSEAARLYVSESLGDYGTAKRKALDSLRLGNDVSLPRDDEVERAVLEYQRLFKADSQAQTVRDGREAALRLMRQWSRFSPRLVGPLVAGVGDYHHGISLHLFADPPEAVNWSLLERRVRFDAGEVQVRFSGGAAERLPCFNFDFRGWEVQAIVFSGRQRRRTPVTAGEKKPIDRVGVSELESLLAFDATAHGGL